MGLDRDQLLEELKSKARFWFDGADEQNWSDAKEAILDAAWAWAEADSKQEAA